MPKSVHNGYFVSIPAESEFQFKARSPEGIYIHHNLHKVFIDYAGLEGRQPSGFEIPGNTDFLREMAEAFEALADDIDRLRVIKR